MARTIGSRRLRSSSSNATFEIGLFPAAVFDDDIMANGQDPTMTAAEYHGHPDRFSLSEGYLGLSSDAASDVPISASI